ncbi:MAG: YkgJ family cysteine cluster protein [Chitinophagaceae bacterium]|nr:YkgJ family cysteine cluster protein [Chitinophagaceae bacterium]
MIDNIVFALQEAVTQQIDCKKCGNCCKSLMIVVTEEELQKVAAKTNTPSDEFKSSFLAEGLSGKLIMNAMPCHFYPTINAPYIPIDLRVAESFLRFICPGSPIGFSRFRCTMIVVLSFLM